MFNTSGQRNRFVALVVSKPGECQISGISGNELVVTYSHQEALAELSGQRFNLIILDIDLQALDLLVEIKTANGINSHTPVIALMETLESSRRKPLIAAGFDDCLQKPLTYKNLDELAKFWQESTGTRLEKFYEDFQVLLVKSKNNERLVKVLYGKLFEEMPFQIDRLETAIAIKDYQTAFSATHSINGNARTCYLRVISETANALEACLLQKNYEFAEGFFLMLKQGVTDFIDHRSAIMGFFSTGQ